MTEEYFRKVLNRCFPQEGLSMVKKSDLDYSRELEGGWDEIEKILISWEKLGLIRILSYPHNSSNNDVCIQILKFLDGETFPSDWIRDSTHTKE
jgi:hypothetical protein